MTKNSFVAKVTFNAPNTLWEKYINHNNKIGISLEELIQRHGLYVVTDLDHTYKYSPNCHKPMSKAPLISLSLAELTTSLLK